MVWHGGKLSPDDVLYDDRRWILLYVFKMAGGEFEGKNADEIAGVFGNLMEQPG